MSLFNIPRPICGICERPVSQMKRQPFSIEYRCCNHLLNFCFSEGEWSHNWPLRVFENEGKPKMGTHLTAELKEIRDKHKECMMRISKRAESFEANEEIRKQCIAEFKALTTKNGRSPRDVIEWFCIYLEQYES